MAETTIETREVSGFDAVSLETYGNVTISQGDRESLTVEALPDRIALIETRVEDGVLRILHRKKLLRPVCTRRETVRFDLVVKELRSLDVSGAGNVDAETLTTDTLALAVSGAGRVTIAALEAGDLAVDLSGAGKCVVGGRVESQSIDISGAGEFDGGKLESRRAAVEVSGVGGVTVDVSEALTAEISGTGRISYYGSPLMTQRVTGIGKITSLGIR